MSVARQVQTYFDSVAAGYHSASQNPVWGLVRSREQAALRGMLGDVAGCDVLELGCGAGFYTRTLLAAGAAHVWAVDFSAPMLAELPTDGVTPIHGDAAAVDPGRTFPLIVSAGMLEFVPDPEAVLRNAARLAEPEGRLVLLYPTRGLLGLAYQRFHRRNNMEIRLFDDAGLRRMAWDAGWSVARSMAAGPYSATSLLELRA